MRHICPTCQTSFAQKGHLDAHLRRKRPCERNEQKREERVQEILTKTYEELRSLYVPTEQDTGKYRTNTKDQFFTNDRVATECIATLLTFVPNASEFLWIEPSAGSGTFLRALPPSFEMIGLDIDPQAPDIQSQNYLTWTPPAHKECVVFGNPPFGRQSSLAKAFITKSCEFANTIAFILPRSFTKPSMFGVFESHFHLVHSTELAKNSFLLNGSPYDVPCVFQIWQKQTMPRSVEAKVLPFGFHYVKSTEHHHLAIRRVGGRAGACFQANEIEYAVQSHYFVTLEDTYILHRPSICDQLNKHVFPSNTVGPRSLSKPEVNVVLNSILRTVLL